MQWLRFGMNHMLNRMFRRIPVLLPSVRLLPLRSQPTDDPQLVHLKQEGIQIIVKQLFESDRVPRVLDDMISSQATVDGILRAFCRKYLLNSSAILRHEPNEIGLVKTVIKTLLQIEDLGNIAYKLGDPSKFANLRARRQQLLSAWRAASTDPARKPLSSDFAQQLQDYKTKKFTSETSLHRLKSDIGSEFARLKNRRATLTRGQIAYMAALQQQYERLQVVVGEDASINVDTLLAQFTHLLNRLQVLGQNRSRARSSTNVGVKDSYQILGVLKTASDNSIKKRYRKLVRELHPDQNPDADQSRFREVNEAWDQIKQERGIK